MKPMYCFHLYVRDEKINAERLSNLPKDMQLTDGDLNQSSVAPKKPYVT